MLSLLLLLLLLLQLLQLLWNDIIKVLGQRERKRGEATLQHFRCILRSGNDVGRQQQSSKMYKPQLGNEAGDDSVRAVCVLEMVA